MTFKSTLHQLFAAASLLSLVCLSAQAQNFPNKPIQVVVPVAAGGGTDLLARNLSQRVSEILGQPLVVENKLGAGGNIGVEYVMKSKADGYTLLISPATIATNVAVYKKFLTTWSKICKPLPSLVKQAWFWWCILQSRSTTSKNL